MGIIINCVVVIRFKLFVSVVCVWPLIVINATTLFIAAIFIYKIAII